MTGLCILNQRFLQSVNRGAADADVHESGPKERNTSTVKLLRKRKLFFFCAMLLHWSFAGVLKKD